MKLMKLATAFALAASAAWANEDLIQIRDHAGKLEQEYRELGTKLKVKSFNAAELQDRLGAANSDISRLKDLVAGFDTSNPGTSQRMDEATAKDWKTTQVLVKLIELFHNEKLNTLNNEPLKKRGLLKSNADGLVRRTAMLRETVDRLLKNMPAGS